MKIGKNSTPQRTALIYAFFGVLWILISDLVLQLSTFPPPFKYLIIETLKGWLFVLTSAGLIYFILRREVKSQQEKQS